MALAKRFETGFMAMDLPTNWICEKKQLQWTCTDNGSATTTAAIIVISGKQASQNDAKPPLPSADAVRMTAWPELTTEPRLQPSGRRYSDGYTPELCVILITIHFEPLHSSLHVVAFTHVRDSSYLAPMSEE